MEYPPNCSRLTQQAEKQLDEVRQEVKSEKLEATKTEVKAAFVAKGDSLFGSGKLKEFEHRNEDLQKRIQELEEKALLREEQYSKQIQEMKNAYEQQYRKLAEFTFCQTLLSLCGKADADH